MTGAGLKIALVTTFYPPFHFGGDGNYVRQQAHALARRGHQVDVIHNRDAWELLSKEPMQEPLAEPAGVNVVGLQSRFPALTSFVTHQTGTAGLHSTSVSRLLDAKKYDIIHYHNISLMGGPSILSRGSGIKIYTAHEHWLICPTHILWRHNREPCTGRECFRCGLSYKRPPQLWRFTGLLDKSVAHVDAFCALSKFSADKHREFGFNRELTVMPSFLPDSDDTQQNEPASTSRPFFLFVGRLEKIKGAQEIIPAFIKDTGADLIVVGSGEYESQLKEIAGNSPYIRFTGKLDATALKPLYRGACAVLLPSICYEVFPLVALESFREGTPIIAHNRGPFPEIVEASKGGMLYHDSDSLNKAVNTLLSDRMLRDEMGAASRQSYGDLWSETQSFKVYFELLKKIAIRRGHQTTIDLLDQCSKDGYLEADVKAAHSPSVCSGA